VRTWVVPNRIEVSLTTHRLTVFDGDTDTVLFDTDVATGRPNTPTPVGDFYIDIVNPLGGHRVYGWGQLSVSGFSDVLESFGGGIGQIAIHGWNDDSVMGTSASNGCVRMRNVDIARVAELAPLGTPVRITP
jgi:lipoprotein-anchoring transpeptidase ErfK/SrfK